MNVLYESSGKTCSVASGTKWARYKPDVPDLCPSLIRLIMELNVVGMVSSLSCSLSFISDSTL